MFTRNAVVVAMLLYIRAAWAIHCYDCNSHNNSMCLDPSEYDEETLRNFMPAVQCGQGLVSGHPDNFFCRKIVQTILHKGYEPDVRVTRGCGWVRSHKECYKADNEDHLETVCQCFNDACNEASYLDLSVPLLAIAAMLSKVLMTMVY